MYSESITKLISAFKKLPTVGQRAAERYVFYLLKSGKKEVATLILALSNLIKNIKSCSLCWDFDDCDPCKICSDLRRDKSVLCVVAEPQDLQVIESTGKYNGLYFVMRGLIDADYQETDKVKIKELVSRIEKDKKIKEVILALNPDMQGEITMMYARKIISSKNKNIKITRLARGLPINSDLQYADETTLAESLKNRS
ncbi:MAG: recombination mediator RecR [bacterium]